MISHFIFHFKIDIPYIYSFRSCQDFYEVVEMINTPLLLNMKIFLCNFRPISDFKLPFIHAIYYLFLHFV